MVSRRGSVFALGILFLLFQSTFQQSAPSNERVSMIQLRSSLGLRGKDWPIKRETCTWSGVRCRNGRITGINISGFRRTRRGQEKPQFAVDGMANLTGLESFNASGFLLPGQIPNWFGQRLVALQVLDLRSCSINGSIPSSLGNLTNLSALYLSHNALTETIPSSLGQLGSLSVLDLAGNSLTGAIPSLFALLMNLTVLDLSSNGLSGAIPPAIGVLSKLQVLNLSNNSLSSSIPAQLGDLSSLVEFDLSFNSLTGSVPADLRGLRNLQKLVLGNNLLAGSLPDTLFPPLNKLQFIFLNHNGFVGGLPFELWSMPELSLLDASGNSFTGTLPYISVRDNATAALLNLSGNMFYGGLTSVITRFRFVDLTGSYLEGPVSDYARSYASLDKNCLQSLTTQRNLVDCSSFYAERGLQFDNFGLPNAPPPSPAPAQKSKKKLIILAGALGGVLFLGLLAIVLVLVILCIRKRGVVHQREMGVGPVAGDGSSRNPELSLEVPSFAEAFTYEQVLQATDDFSDLNLIKNGASGDLYEGLLEGGKAAVIKRIHLLSVKKETYRSELDFFSKISHTRFVPLLGHCSAKENEKFLVYKYLPNGDLSTALYKKKNSEDDSLQSLDWITRLKIAIGAAEGLSYLHHECTPPLVHRDVQASSILLDDKFEVRLGSLGDVCAQEDTSKPIITRLLRLQTISDQRTSGLPSASCTYDVYCFGKVLLELITGKLGISAPNENKMKDWLEETLSYISIYEKETVTKIVDPSLIIDEDLLEEVWAMAIVAKSCLNPKPSRRPLMRYVLKALENPLKVVRDENYSSGRLRTNSSKGSWNAVGFGSWRNSSSDAMAVPATLTAGGGGGGGGMYKQSGLSASRGSGQYGGGGDRSSSSRRHSKEIYPEPSDTQDVEAKW